MKALKLLLFLTVAAAIGGTALVYSGVYDIGADTPHNRPVFIALDTLRDHSVVRHARDIQAPADLEDPQKILVGAGQYAAMCSGCHLAPGYDSNETWAGLYPQPPRLANGTDLNAAETFWVIKHGIKMSGMPAWGATHDDEELWAITAFVLKLPTMDAQQYREIVARAPADDDMTRMPMPGRSGREAGPGTAHDHANVPG